MEVVIQSRKKFFSTATLECLQDVQVLNPTKGCAFGCIYCYANHGSQNSLVADPDYANRVIGEYSRKRKKPSRVYFSTMCDVFQPQISEPIYRVMEYLLGVGVSIEFLTKGWIPDSFIELFARYPKQISAQIGLCSVNPEVCALLEPGAAPPDKRVSNLTRLLNVGIVPTVRLDPLFPELTDKEEELRHVFEAIQGVKEISVSYLFMRPCFRKNVLRALEGADSKDSEEGGISYSQYLETLYAGGQELSLAGSPYPIVALPPEDRQKRYLRIENLAREYHLSMNICSCKNGDISNSKCHIVRDIEDL